MIGPIKLPIMKVSNRNSWGMKKKLVILCRIPPGPESMGHTPESRGDGYQLFPPGNDWTNWLSNMEWNVCSWWGTVSTSWLAWPSKGWKKNPTFRSLCLVRTGDFTGSCLEIDRDWNTSGIYSWLYCMYIYIYLKTNTNTSEYIGMNIDIKREHKYRYDHRYTAEYNNTYR